ncbi:MlaD family protein [Mycolicibacterium parafortuitum]|uniref:MCE family protein n=1 Tax=Mycolicibacterium parafortuitum TaxID=39692 RepID=A0ACC6MQ01_MYCPF|nr:MlaD family protein [Mycolicibacterium parafortuitum]MDZ5089085.1 MCE family protein [Mycolicibacterium parafortuitum]
MLTRFVRTQLAIFVTVSVIGVAAMALFYVQVPTLLGIGRYTVTLELPSTGGLYRFSNVTVRGVQVGKVTDIAMTHSGPRATLSLSTSPRVPADLHAEVRSVSAVGEQYVDLQPRTDAGPFLGNGSVIPADEVSVPQKVGPMLDQVSALLGSVPQERIADLLDETSQALDGSSYDLGSLIDSSAAISADLADNADPAARLIDDSAPLLDGQLQTTDAVRQWAENLAGITRQIDENDAAVRNILQSGPGAADETARLLSDLQPTLPVLLANLTTVGQIALTYNPGVEQLLVLFPPYVAALQGFALPWNNPTGWPLGDFTATSGDPPACTVGFLPPSEWRSPADYTEIETPDDLYCKLPQDSPLAVRGARNTPCMEQPGKRAPTVEMCNSDRPYYPLSLRQHALGPNPIDPNQIAQGIPPDSRILPGEGLYGPIEGTPMPPGAAPVPAPADPGSGESAPPAPPVIPPGPVPAAPPGVPPGPVPAAPSAIPPGPVPAAPSAHTTDDASSSPSMSYAQYDPATGRYVTADGRTYRQADLAGPGTARTWQDLFPT